MHSWGLLRQRRERRAEQRHITGSSVNELKIEREGDVTCGCEEEVEEDEDFLRNCSHHPTHLKRERKDRRITSVASISL